jgi:hypothetical protein
MQVNRQFEAGNAGNALAPRQRLFGRDVLNMPTEPETHRRKYLLPKRMLLA